MTTAGVTRISALEDGKVRSFEISPEEAGLARAAPEALKGGDAAHNARALRNVLEGEKNAYRDIAVLNAGAALVVAGRAADLADGIAQAGAAIDDGHALATLDRLVAVSNAGARA
jgi:anthranilate phosphoribosyltransferase